MIAVINFSVFILNTKLGPKKVLGNMFYVK